MAFSVKDYTSAVRHAECRLSLEAHKHRSLAAAAQNVVKILSRDRKGAVLRASEIINEIHTHHARGHGTATFFSRA